MILPKLFKDVFINFFFATCSRREGTNTYITAVFNLRSITGVVAHFVCTQHVFCELPAKVVAAFAPSEVDHLCDHLFELVCSAPQVIDGPPSSCFHLLVHDGVSAALPQVFHGFDGLRFVKWTIQLQ